MNAETAILQAEYAHIVCLPKVMSGEPHIAGHRIRVRDIVAARDRGGFTPEEIAASVYPHLTLAQVYSALAYYEDHRQQIDGAVRSEAQLIGQFQQQYPELVRDIGSIDGQG
jgi:uncharacterized protein (DUF433 family)